MIGRATSVNEDRNRPCNTVLNPDEDFDEAIGQAYACIQGCHPEEIILSEKLSERDGELLDGRMSQCLALLLVVDWPTVPDLPPPNIHPRTGMGLPDSIRCTQQKFLRKVKGIHSLAMALSWM